MHENRPPAAQLLFDCGIIYDNDPLLCESMITHTPPPAPYPQPQLNVLNTSTEELSQAIQQPLPLRLGPTPPSAALNAIFPTKDPYADSYLRHLALMVMQSPTTESQLKIWRRFIFLQMHTTMVSTSISTSHMPSNLPILHGD